MPQTIIIGGTQQDMGVATRAVEGAIQKEEAVVDDGL
jgi:hypothetical protein